MNKLQQQVDRAARSRFHLWLLNRVLLRTVPFNRPHGLKIVRIQADALTVRARPVRANQNHVKGIHACLLATLCEYVSGLGLLLHVDPGSYRILLKNIRMTYHYQAKKEVFATFSWNAATLESELLEPLQEQGILFKEFTVDIFDADRNHICTGLINWQIKAWAQARVKV